MDEVIGRVKKTSERINRNGPPLEMLTEIYKHRPATRTVKSGDELLSVSLCVRVLCTISLAFHFRQQLALRP